MKGAHAQAPGKAPRGRKCEGSTRTKQLSRVAATDSKSQRGQHLELLQDTSKTLCKVTGVQHGRLCRIPFWAASTAMTRVTRFPSSSPLSSLAHCARRSGHVSRGPHAMAPTAEASRGQQCAAQSREHVLCQRSSPISGLCAALPHNPISQHTLSCTHNHEVQNGIRHGTRHPRPYRRVWVVGGGGAGG